MIKPTFYRWDRPQCWGANIKEIFRWVHQFFIRGAQGWCYSDVWNLDSYLVGIILPALKELKENKQSYPIIDESLREESAITLWNQKLDGMIAGFEAAKQIHNSEWQNIEHYKELEAKFKEGMRDFTEYFFNLWD